MRDLALRVLFLWGCLLGPAFSYGIRSAAEQASFWYVYVLEGKALEAKLDNFTPIVAVECGAKMRTDGKRCSLDDFVRYLWSEQVDSEGNPKNTPFPTGKIGPPPKNQAWESTGIDQVFGAINRSGFVDGVKGSKLVTGATSFWEARRQVTAPLAQIAARMGDFHKKGAAQKILDKAKAANMAAYMIRLYDYEKYRITEGGLNQRLGHGITVSTKRLDTGLKGYTFDALDAEATLANNADLTQEALQTGVDDFRNHDPGHWTALQAGRAALTNGNCALPDVANIALK
ncbi:hypothetical protein FE257_006533 [Aspergillus nanangensis]|uniref:Uncharacterized protein n=1 Tax=Aspergillus nanangensis TaxID=2582783 RepID=A0AAD4CXP7_ASPNN|nr:hypothetical protein FE257_006533 [Aspergillus nanangensis]